MRLAGKVLGAACAALAIGVSTGVCAQGFPNKPLRMVVPFPAGGAADAMARVLVEKLKDELKQNVVIDNKAGELKAGSSAKAHVPTSKNEKITVAPQRAVYYVLGSNKAFVVKDGVIEARDVKLGDRIDQDVEILEGLAEGETVATSQMVKLDTGTKVKLAVETPKNGVKKGS